MRFQTFIILTVFAGCSLDSDPKIIGQGPISSGETISNSSTSVTVSFLGDGENWTETGKRMEIFDDHNRVREVLMSKSSSDQPFESALTFEYDNSGQKSSESFWHWTKGMWVEVSRVFTTYQEGGFVESERGSSIEGDELVESSLVQYSYSGPNGNYTKLKSVPRYDAEGMPDTFGSSVNESITMWQNQSLEEVFFTNGRMDSTRAYSWNQESWFLSGKVLFEYDKTGLLSRRLILRLGSATWVPTLQTLFTYSDGIVKEAQHSRYEMSRWIITGKDVHQ